MGGSELWANQGLVGIEHDNLPPKNSGLAATYCMVTYGYIWLHMQPVIFIYPLIREREAAAVSLAQAKIERH